MKFLMISTPDEKITSAPPDMEMMARMGEFVEEQIKAGVLLATGGLLPASRGGAYVRSSGGKFTVTDGPFIETKELMAGFALIEVKSKEEAIEACRRFYEIAGDGVGEIRQIIGPEDDFVQP